MTTNSGNFHISGGQIISPDGSVFEAQGINVLDTMLPTLVSNGQLLQNFPNMNFVRIVGWGGYGFDSSQPLIDAINSLTAKGIVVDFDNFNSGNGGVATGSDLTQELSWLTQMATVFKDNPYVWFGTDNEPEDGSAGGSAPAGSVTAEQVADYNAIRAVGDNAPVVLEGATQAALTASSYAGMTNVVWDDHFYNWTSGYSADMNTLAANLQSVIAPEQAIKSADGSIPIIIGEFGTATNGTTFDPGGTQTVQTVLNNPSDISGWSAFCYYWPQSMGGTPGSEADNLVNESTGALTNYGQQVVGAMTAAKAPGSGNPPPPPAATSPDNTVIKASPAGASIVDASGNSWTIANGVVDKNGSAAGYSTNVTELAWEKGVIWQENSSSTWYSWTGTGWTGGTATSPVPTPSADNTVILASQAGASIVDASGNSWTIANGVVDENGAAAGFSANVTELAWEKGTIWQENSSSMWWNWTGTGWTGGVATSPVPPPSAPVSVGTGSDSIVLKISEDAYANGDGKSDAAGDATFTVSVDGKQLAGTFTATASHAAGQDQNFTLKGDWAPGTHTVAVDFLNDAYAGTPSTDRNLYVDGVTYDGTSTGQSAALMSAGTHNFTVTDSTALPASVVGSGSDKLTVKVSEDAYLGNAQFTVAVDGKQLGGTFTATTLHSSGGSQAFNFAGDFGTGQHTVKVAFLNDAYGGTPSLDRNLYVNDIIYNGTDTGDSLAEKRTGSGSFTVTGGTAPSVNETSDHGSLQKTLSQTGTYTVGGDTFVLGTGNTVSATLGSGTSNIAFIGPNSLKVTGGSGSATVTADTGTNTFTAGSGSMDVTGGGGADTFVFHASSGMFTIEDFSVANGDKLLIDTSLKSSMVAKSDGEGGTMLSFGASHAIDLHGLAAAPTVTWS